MTFSEAKQYPITEYLSRLGFKPSKVRGHECWYLSPLRAERTASFKVDTKLNRWYDHGQGEGGSILDLGAKLEQCSVTEFKDRLAKDAHFALSLHRSSQIPDTPTNKVEVVSIQPLTDKLLLNYLKSRGIESETAKTYCKEISFNIGRRNHKAIGFPNRSGGFELRNTWFKGAASPKDISIINLEKSQAVIFEGFMDFLSFLELQNKDIAPVKDSGFIILNSVAFVSRILDLLVPSNKEVSLYLDNDLAGRSAKQKLSDGGLTFKDESHLYIASKDVNEFLITLLKAKAFQNRSKRPKF